MRQQHPRPIGIFVCHASEDKARVARPLSEELRRRSFDVWYDDFSLQLGDSLSCTIDRGLARADYGVVILSPAFFSKEWPQRELRGLLAREVGEGRKIVLPIWHAISSAEIRTRTPLLADKLAVSTASGLERAVDAIVSAIREDRGITDLLRELHQAIAELYAAQMMDGADPISNFGEPTERKGEMIAARNRIDGIKERLRLLGVPA